ncbi:hypothetical protein VHEMI00303 [[Torrubiella] hemipterigena]|uniref:Uncharacterized protein n=1 Tax=[Torrubiella] hemipterigena TaxID=1531966 RepID=A0A0A1SIZ5_9HYPO|nr:hypothetical protein VHEMI00303 [[Torrubiella] hemipterigena]
MSIMVSYSWKRIVVHVLACLLLGTLSSRVLSTPHVSAGVINCDAKVAIAVFVHDQNMDSILDSVKRFEDTFNHQCRHDLVFFSSSPLSEDNKQVAANRTRGTCIFETIPVNLWKVDRWSRIEAESTRVSSNNFVLLNNCSTAEADANLPCWSSVSIKSLKRLQQYDWCWKIQVHDVGSVSGLRFEAFKISKAVEPGRSNEASVQSRFINSGSLSDNLRRESSRMPLFEDDGTALGLGRSDNGIPTKKSKQPSLTKSIKSWLSSTTKRG